MLMKEQMVAEDSSIRIKLKKQPIGMCEQILYKYEQPHGPGDVYFVWQKAQGSLLATTGSDGTVAIFNRQGQMLERIILTGWVKQKEVYPYRKSQNFIGICCHGLVCSSKIGVGLFQFPFDVHPWYKGASENTKNILIITCHNFYFWKSVQSVWIIRTKLYV